MYLTYAQALVLKEIAKGKAEINTNYEPATFYINESQTSDDPVALEALERSKHSSLVDEQIIEGCLYVYTINQAGISELRRHFASFAEDLHDLFK